MVAVSHQGINDRLTTSLSHMEHIYEMSIEEILVLRLSTLNVCLPLPTNRESPLKEEQNLAISESMENELKEEDP